MGKIPFCFVKRPKKETKKRGGKPEKKHDNSSFEDFRLFFLMNPNSRRGRYIISARAGHVVACFGNFMVVWGGYQVSEPHSEKYCPSHELWIYNSLVRQWKCYKTRGEVPQGRSGSIAHMIDHYFYVHGGHTESGNTNSIYRLDMQTLTWQKLLTNHQGLLPSPRDKQASWLYKNKIYCFGGHGPAIEDYLCNSGEYVKDHSSGTTYPRGWNNQLLIFDTETGQWSNPKCSGQIPSPRAAHAATRIGSTVYVFGGRHLQMRTNDLHSLDLETNAWTKLETNNKPPCGRSWSSFTAVSPTRILLCGGFTQDNRPLTDLWLLNVPNLQWQRLPQRLSMPRLWHSCCVTRDEDILIFGGCCSNILDYEREAVHTNEVLCLRVNPKSLVRLCVECLVANSKQTKSEWKYLPEALFKLVTLNEESSNMEQNTNSGFADLNIMTTY